MSPQDKNESQLGNTDRGIIQQREGREGREEGGVVGTTVRDAPQFSDLNTGEPHGGDKPGK